MLSLSCARAILFVSGLALAVAGCLPSQASYDVGLGTNRVSGFLNVDRSKPLPGGALIVVYKYHHQFINQQNGAAVLRPSAHVVQPGSDGGYSIAVPADVVSMDVLFIAPEHLTQVFRFRRQIGVGDIRYRADLVPMPDWRSHYYTYLNPQLENLIVESRYRLAPEQQQLLSEWLTVQNNRQRPQPGTPAP